MNQWHALEVKRAFKELDSGERGLNERDAEERVARFGENRLVESKKKSPLLMLLRQFTDFLVIILIIASVVSFAIGDVIDSAVILVIVVLNSVLGFFQEYRAEKAMEALKRISAQKAIVIRNGFEKIIDSSNLVPGDIVVLSEGQRVPADLRLFECINLKLGEASLTGESTPVEKETGKIKGTISLAERKNMAYMNTIASYGRGKGIVVATGMNTEFGKIATMIQEIEKEQTPLTRRLTQFGKSLGLLIIALCALIFFIGITLGLETRLMFLTSISLAVGAIPEGLPAVVTVTLALGMRAMAKKNAIVRKIAAVETLGSCTVICSDKTGTLTKNEMTVRKILCNNAEYAVSGRGYSSQGTIKLNGREIKRPPMELRLLFQDSMLCNTARFSRGEAIGDPTELALLVLGKKAGFERTELEKEFSFEGEVPFDSERKMMTSVFRHEGKKIAFTKGSSESVLEKCAWLLSDGKKKRLDRRLKAKITKENNEMAKQGLRVLGFAFKELKGNEKNIESSLVFLGLAGMIDSPREEAIEAVEKCKLAGIDVKMVTGDHKLTAIAIARELGIHTEKVLTGSELENMSEGKLSKIIGRVNVFARVNPEHKVRIINALKKRNEIISMTGDGVNDAPALKMADIGVAMGVTGTDVTKEASDMVITDDNFATIVNAVEEGRKIYANIKNFVKYMLSANAAEVLTITIAIIIISLFRLDYGLPLLPVQILWINLVTDGLPAIALGNEPADREIMLRKPRQKNEKILSGTIEYIIVAGVIGTLVTLGSFFLVMPAGIDAARTAAFSTLILFELFFVFNCRSDKTAFEVSPFSNKALVLAVLSSALLLLAVVYVPVLQPYFHTTELSLQHWLLVLVLSMSGLIIPFIVRMLGR